MGRFDIHRCRVCGTNEFEDRMICYNDHFFCGIRCRVAHERTENESLRNPPSRSPVRITRNDGDPPDTT